MNKIKTRLFFVFRMVFILFVFHGCSDEAQDNRDIINRKLAQDKDLQALVSIKDEYIGRIITGNVPLEELQKAYEEGDEQRILILLSYTAEEAEEINQRLLTVSERIKKRYPSLEATRLKSSCVECEQDISDFFRNFDEYAKQVGIPRLKSAASEGSGGSCRDYVGYAACLLKCIGSFPSYGPCATQCHKDHCE